MIEIREYQKIDRKGIIDVCAKTGYMGEDARNYFDDHYLFGLLFCLYYVDYEPENCFVAMDVKDKTVVGYVLSSINSQTQKRIFTRKMMPKILFRTIFYTSWRYRQSFAIVRHMRRMEARNTDPSLERELFLQYPAHLHINILPQYHRKGIGTRLIRRLEAHISSTNCRGIHLHTSSQNIKALPFYTNLDYFLLHSSPMGTGMWPEAPPIKSLIYAKEMVSASEH